MRSQGCGFRKAEVAIELKAVGSKRNKAGRCRPIGADMFIFTGLLHRRLLLGKSGSADSFVLFIGLGAIGESRIPKASSDSGHTPSFHIAHERRFAEALHHSIIMNENHRLMVAYSRDRLLEFGSKIELIA